MRDLLDVIAISRQALRDMGEGRYLDQDGTPPDAERGEFPVIRSLRYALRIATDRRS